jgi:hypothetical protein
MHYLNKQNAIALSINLIASLIFTLGSLLFVTYFMPGVSRWLKESTTLTFANIYLLPLLLFAVSFATISALLLSRLFSRVQGYSGREQIMSMNLAALQRRYNGKELFWSTRLTFWNIAEDSPARVAFRRFITHTVHDKCQVRRIWHIKTHPDYDKMKFYLDSYKNFENYHVKVIIGGDVYMPEMAGIGERIALVSLPSSANPASIVNTIQFYRRKEIRKIKEYFDLVWDRALPIKIGGHVFTENVEQVFRSLGRGT